MRWKVFLSIFFLICLGVTFAEVVGNSPSEVYIFNFQILFDTFNGDTNDFNLYNETELSNLSGVILERTSYGNISFQENLDLVTMAGPDGIVNFDRDVDISDNLIYVDNYYLPGINKPVILSLYGLSYTDPEIYHNGIICSNCNLISYSGGNIVFSSPSFSGVYYIREVIVPPFCGDGICNGAETCTSCPADCGTCPPDEPPSGGGGETPPTNITIPGQYDFTVEPWYFELEMGKGTYYQKIVTVTNNGTRPVPILINVEELGDFIFPEVRGFILPVGESRDIRLDIYISSQRFADVYVGRVSFTSGSTLRRNVEVILDVKERNALFDIRTEVLKKYINPGGRVRANITILNMGDLRNFDVSLEYKMIDFEKNEYTIKKEDFAINRTYNNIFYLDVPEDAPIGNYLFYARVNYQDINASSYDTFTVESVSSIAWIFLILIILILMYLIYRWYKSEKEGLVEKEKRRLMREEEEKKIAGQLPKKDEKGKIELPELP